MLTCFGLRKELDVGTIGSPLCSIIWVLLLVVQELEGVGNKVHVFVVVTECSTVFVASGFVIPPIDVLFDVWVSVVSVRLYVATAVVKPDF